MNFNAFSSHFYYAKFPNALMSIYTPIISTAMMIIFSRLLGLLNSLIYSPSPKHPSPNFFSDRSSKETVIPANSSLRIGYRMISETSSLCTYNKHSSFSNRSIYRWTKPSSLSILCIIQMVYR